MAGVTLRNIERNIALRYGPAVVGSVTSKGISPFRGIPDVTPLPRDSHTNARFHGGGL